MSIKIPKFRSDIQSFDLQLWPDFSNSHITPVSGSQSKSLSRRIFHGEKVLFGNKRTEFILV
jgi:hypothetical protein